MLLMTKIYVDNLNVMLINQTTVMSELSPQFKDKKDLDKVL